MGAPAERPPAEAATDRLSPQARRGMLAIMLSLALAVLDIAIANTALPAIGASIHTDAAASVWIVNAYQLAAAATLLPFAALGGIVGHRRVYLSGLALFIFASLLCALAGSLSTLAAARVLQGIGGSAVMSVNAALIAALYPAHRLGRGLGLNALVVGTCFALGPTIASLVLAVASWPWLFAINLPLGLLALGVGASSLPRTPRSGHAFDGLAMAYNVTAFAALILALSEMAQRGPVWLSLGALAAAGVAMAALVRRETGHPAPMLPVDLLRRPLFALSALTALCAFATQGLAFVSLPFYFEDVLRRSPVETGFLLAPWSIVVALMAPLAGRLSDRHAPGLLGGIGLVILGLGMLTLALLPAAAQPLDIIWRMSLCGLGFGFFQSPNQRALIGAAPKARSGGASGTIATARLLGQTLGAALVALAFGLAGGHGPILALAMGAGFAAVGAVASSLRLVVARPVDGTDG
jgi:DHA2 family multidrug resistance protein-like MFS transporter